jgi:hypothetical protein
MYYLKLYREKEGNSNKRSDTLGKRGNRAASSISKVIHPKYYKQLKKGAHQSHLGKQIMG